MAQAKPLISGNIVYKTVGVGNYQIFYREAGEQHKPTVLFLHGFPSSSRMWQPLLNGLSNDYRVITPDYIGFGHSSQPDADSFDYTFDNDESAPEALDLIKNFLKNYHYNSFPIFKISL